MGGNEFICDRCNGPNTPPWYAPNDLWNTVVGDEGGMLCPTCFIACAQAAGIGGIWRVALDGGSASG